MKSAKVTFIICILNMFYSDAMAYNYMEYAHEDSGGSGIDFFVFLACLLIAYPILLLAFRLKIKMPEGCSLKNYWKNCFITSAKLLLPLSCLLVFGSVLSLFAGFILLAITNLIFKLISMNIDINNITSLIYVCGAIYLSWYIFSVYWVVKELSVKNEDEKHL